MANFNKSRAPYYDDYDSSKQYTHLLAIPGRVAQAREITQIQSTIKDIVKSIGDSILKDGDVIEGCQVIVNTDKKSVTVTEGRVYLNGMVLPVQETIINIDGEKEGVIGNTETIGFILEEKLVTETGESGTALQDITLLDPAQGYENFNQPGCHRIKSEVVIVKDVPESAILATLIDGAVSVENYAPEYDVLTQTLARRTYDESGSYIVDGLEVRVEASNTNSDYFNVVVESGKAYVLGYELKIPAPRRIPVSRSTESSIVSRYENTYNTGNSNYVIYEGAPYVDSILSVEGLLSVADDTGGLGEQLDAPASNADEQELKHLADINASTTSIEGYEYGVDYRLIRRGSRSYVQWLGQSYPTNSYYIKYLYNYTFLQGTDYELYHNTDTGSHEVQWIDKASRTPVSGTSFYTTYRLYLARKDIVYMDQYGNIKVIEGIPAEYGYESLPEAPVNTLALASVMSPPGGSVSPNTQSNISVSNIGLTRFTMNDVQRLLNRIRTLEYDQTILSLDTEAKDHDTPSQKRGIFTDPLIDLSKVDYTYNRDGMKYDVNIDLLNNLCYLPVNANTYDAIYNESSNSKRHDRTITLPKNGERYVLSQMNATKTFLVNPYSMFPQYPEISISPSVDSWIEDSIIEVLVSQNSSEVVSTSTRHVELYNTRGARRADTVTSNSATTAIGTRVETSSNESVIEEKAIRYIRSREIEVEGSQFPGDLNNINCYFDGTRLDLIVDDEYKNGETLEGSVKADASGRFKAKFIIPEGTFLTGTREVRLETTVPGYGIEGSAFALYQASGTNRTIQRTVTTLTTILLSRVTTVTTTHNIDPVGQTFVLDRMTLISGIDLYFAERAEGTTPITCDIREVVNGNITSTVYGHKTLPANEINISADGSVATRFNFDDPVLLEENKEYAFVVRSTSPSYRLWIATLGETDVKSGDPVISNPYLIGVMMSSSNNSSWTSHQTSDIKFRLVEDIYENTSEVIFDDMTDLAEFSRIYLSAESIIPSGTSVTWYYRLKQTDLSTQITDWSTWNNITPYELISLREMNKDISIKAVLSKEESSNLSPLLIFGSIGLGLSSYDKEGYYVSKPIRNLDEYTTVDIIIDSYIPKNTEIKIYAYNGEDLEEADLIPTNTRTLSYGWEERTYRAVVPASTECRVFLKLNSDFSYITPSFRRLRVIMSQ